MTCHVTITSVLGILDSAGNLDLIRVSGTKEDCDFIEVTGCGGLRTIPVSRSPGEVVN